MKCFPLLIGCFISLTSVAQYQDSLVLMPYKKPFKEGYCAVPYHKWNSCLKEKNEIVSFRSKVDGDSVFAIMGGVVADTGRIDEKHYVLIKKRRKMMIYLGDLANTLLKPGDILKKGDYLFTQQYSTKEWAVIEVVVSLDGRILSDKEALAVIMKQ